MRKLKWGLIGGGEGSQIGPAHRLGAGLDGYFEFTAALTTAQMQGVTLGDVWVWQQIGPMAAGRICWPVKPAARTVLTL